MPMRTQMTCFRPLAGLSCINPYEELVDLLGNRGSFRPLAGLSCINQAAKQAVAEQYGCKFPSPRGVELHKPGCETARFALIKNEFPSPRGVELHKPCRRAQLPVVSLGEFPSPRGVELHKPCLG